MMFFLAWARNFTGALQLRLRMIQPNELRIGNWVLEGGEPSLIYSLSIGGLTFHKVNDINIHNETLLVLETHEDRFAPIPLTPEILEQCGVAVFDNKPGVFILPNSPFLITEGEGYYSLSIGVGLHQHLIRIFDLHQLQNLYFALTGRELEVNLTTKQPA